MQRLHDVHRSERVVDSVVVGGGQAGLATAHHLRRRGVEHVVLDAGSAVGQSWRERWDSLRLFTPAGFSHLPGLRLPLPARALPGKDDAAAYLDAYADGLPVELRTAVDTVRRAGDGWLVAAGERRWRARNVIIATGAHAVPRVPPFLLDLPALHSSAYRRPDELPDGPVLVVGAGNSGAEIALELARSRQVWLAGPAVGAAPRLGNGGYRVLRALGRPGASLAARLPERGADPLGHVRTADLAAAGIRRLPRVSGVHDGLPVAGRPVEAAAVVWCTGYGPALGFLDVDGSDGPGRADRRFGPLVHRHGVTDHPGLYLVGAPLQTSMTSHLLGGVGRDAAYVVTHLARAGRCDRSR